MKQRPRQGRVAVNYRAKNPQTRKRAQKWQRTGERGGKAGETGSRLAASAAGTAQDGPSILPMKDDGKPLEHMDGTVRV